MEESTIDDSVDRQRGEAQEPFPLKSRPRLHGEITGERRLAGLRSRWFAILKSLSLKTLALLALGALAIPASAQVALTPAEDRVQTLFRQLLSNATDPMSGQVGLRLILTGKDRIVGGAENTIGSDLFLYYLPGTRSDVRVNLVNRVTDSTGTYVTKEVRGDSHTMWVYDDIRRTYSATPYDIGDGGSTVQTPAYFTNALSLLNSAAGTGGAAYETRLLDQLFNRSGRDSTGNQVSSGQTGVLYRPWVSGVAPVEGSFPYRDPLSGLYRDPVTGAELKTTDNLHQPPSGYSVEYVAYAGNPRRTVAFEILVNDNLDISDPNRQVLQRIYFTEASTVNGKQRLVSWAIVPAAITDFSSANFVARLGSQIPNYLPIAAPTATRL